MRIALDQGVVTSPATLFRLSGLAPILSELYAAAGDFAEIVELAPESATPTRPFVPAARFERCIDLRDFAFESAFAGIAMIDFFLRRLGVEPESISPASRRNTWLARRVSPAAPPLDEAYVLLTPHASMRLRDMPPEIQSFILHRVTRAGLAAVTQGAADSPAQHVISSAMTLEALCGWIRHAALVISTDTGIVHLADAFRVPCLAFFTTHRPEWRARDYPLCRSVHLPVAGLPEALEFARNDADLAAARAAWFPHGTDLAWLDDPLSAALASAPGS